jgi:hypothetical protein
MSEKKSYISDNIAMRIRNSIQKKLLKRLKKQPGRAVSAREFLFLGSRASVDQAFSRLVRKRVLRRISRGLYEYPRIGSLFKTPVPQSPDDLVSAWARKNRLKTIPSGAWAANMLGLSTQVPARIVYYTNGRSRNLRLGGYTIRLLNRGPGSTDLRIGISARVVQALRFLGRRYVSEPEFARLRARYRAGDRLEWKVNSNLAPAWIRDIMARIIGRKGAGK